VSRWSVLLDASLLGATLKPITLLGGELILAIVLLTVSELRRVRTSLC